MIAAISVWFIPLAKYILASFALLLFYKAFLRKYATFKESRVFLLSISVLAIAITQFQVEVAVPDFLLKPMQTTLTPIQTSLKPIQSTAEISQAAPVQQTKSTPLPVETKDSITAFFQQFSISEWLLMVYLLVSGLLFLNLLVQYIKINRLKRTGLRSTWNQLPLVVHAKVSSPFSSGRTVFLPENMHQSQREVVIQHENWHIQHKHYFDVFFQEICTCLFWFNPFLWSIRKELRSVHEFQADRSVLNEGCDLFRYQTIILQEVMGSHFRLANGFNQSFTKKRFIQMKNNEPKRTSIARRLLLLPYLLVLFGLFCVTPGIGQSNGRPTVVTKVTTFDKNGKPSMTQKVSMDINAKDLNKKDVDLFLDSISKQADLLIPILSKLEKGGLSTQPKAFDQFLQALNFKINNQVITQNDLPKEFLEQIKPEDFGEMKTYLGDTKKTVDKLKLDQTLSEEDKALQSMNLMQGFLNLGIVQKVMPGMLQFATKVLESTFSSVAQGGLNKLALLQNPSYTKMDVEGGLVEDALVEDAYFKTNKSIRSNKTEAEPVPVYVNPYCKLSDELFEWSKEPFGDIRLVSIEKKKTETIVTLSMPIYQDHWIQFRNNFSIVNQKNGDRYKIRGVENIPMNTEVFFHDVANRMLLAKLIFPPLKSNASVVDILEETSNGWEFRDIRVADFKPNASGGTKGGKVYK